MKRVKAACICQTLHFMLKEETPHELAVNLVRKEIDAYKASLEKNRTIYKILDEEAQPDGSVILKVIKQYNQSPIGDYIK